MGVNEENENAQTSKRYQRGIRTQAHTIASPAFYHRATALHVVVYIIHTYIHTSILTHTVNVCILSLRHRH